MPRRPRARRPKLSRIPGVKAPDLWNLVEGYATGYPVRELRRSERREPAGDPPAWWPGSRPEWAVFWALSVLGLRIGVDFEYRRRMPELESRRWGEVDFLVWSAGVAIEVQGEFAHYGLGSDKLYQDELKRALVESAGFLLVAVDEPDVLRDPLFYVKEALGGRDHSRARVR